MTTATARSRERLDPFAQAEATFSRLVSCLQFGDTVGMSHNDLERLLDGEGRELMRQLLQAHLDLRAEATFERPVVGPTASSGARTRGHRALETIFGTDNPRRPRRAGARNAAPPRCRVESSGRATRSGSANGRRKRRQRERSRKSFRFFRSTPALRFDTDRGLGPGPLTPWPSWCALRGHLSFKADRVFTEKPPACARAVSLLEACGVDRIFHARHILTQYRRWFQRECRDYVLDLLLDPRTRHRAFWNPQSLQRVVSDDLVGSGGTSASWTRRLASS